MQFDELDLGARLLPYEPTWQLQREVHASRRITRHRRIHFGPAIPPTLG